MYCRCTHHFASHTDTPESRRAGRSGCLTAGCRCVKFRQAPKKNCASITPEEKAFAERQVNQLRRMIFDIEQMYGLGE